MAPWIASVVAGAISVLASTVTDGSTMSEGVEAVLIAVAVFTVVRSLR